MSEQNEKLYQHLSELGVDLSTPESFVNWADRASKKATREALTILAIIPALYAVLYIAGMV